MKQFFLLLMAAIHIFPVPLLAYAAGSTSLSGKITDKATGEAIVGASLYIPELKSGAVTDIDGKYTINNLPLRKMTLQVHFLGYKNISEVIDLVTITQHDFQLEQAVTEVQQVTVTGTSKATELKRDPVAVLVVDNTFLQQNQSSNVIEGLAKIPGVSTVTTGPNVSKPFIRGLGFNRILTLYDGTRQEGQQWGDEHGIEVDEYAVDRVEIIKGPASLTYGSDAVGGVVNLLPAVPVADGHVVGSVLANYQTNNRLIGNSIMLSGNHNGLVWSVRGSHKMATNYTDRYDGRVYGTSFRETDVNGYLGINRSWGYSHIGFTVFDDLQAIPDGSRDSASRRFTKQITEEDTLRPIVSDGELTSYKIPTLHQHIQHYRLYSTNNILLGKGKLSITLGYQRSVRQEFSHPVASTTPGLDLLLQTGTYDIKYHAPEKKGWEVMAGINGMYQDNQNHGTEFIIPNYRLFDLGPFVFVKKSFKTIELSGGVRYDVRSFSNDAMYTQLNPATGFDMMVSPPDTVGAAQVFSKFNHVFHGPSGSAGISWSAAKYVTVKANVSSGFRAPNISEISANGVHPGTNIYQIGNGDFKPEFSVQEDLGVFVETEHITFSVEGFNNNIFNYIYNQKLQDAAGNDSVMVAGNETFKFQQTAAQLYGAEANFDLHPHPIDWLHFEAGFSSVFGINHGSSADSLKYLPNIIPIHGDFEIKADLKKQVAIFKNGYLKVGVDLYAKQNRVFSAYNTETPTPGYALLNAGFGTDICTKSGKTVLKLTVLANNLLDQGFQSHLSRLKYFEPYSSSPTGHQGIYNMGRNFSIRLEVPIDIVLKKKAG